VVSPVGAAHMKGEASRVRIAPGSPFVFAHLHDPPLRALRIESPNQTEPILDRRSASHQLRVSGMVLTVEQRKARQPDATGNCECPRTSRPKDRRRNSTSWRWSATGSRFPQ
jgi:hypothetical protein